VLSGTGLVGLALLTMECLEAAVRTQAADAFGAEIESAWMRSGTDALNQPPEEPEVDSVEEPPCLHRASKMLLEA
jgi:hypothetical protein